MADDRLRRLDRRCQVRRLVGDVFTHFDHSPAQLAVRQFTCLNCCFTPQGVDRLIHYLDLVLCEKTRVSISERNQTIKRIPEIIVSTPFGRTVVHQIFSDGYEPPRRWAVPQLLIVHSRNGSSVQSHVRKLSREQNLVDLGRTTFGVVDKTRSYVQDQLG